MRTNFYIKKASLPEVPVIKELAGAIWSPTYLPILSKEQVDYMFSMIYLEDALTQQMKEGQTFLIIYQESKPIGFAAYSVKDATNKIYKLNKIYLLPECQGKGAGKKLLEHVEKDVKQLGATFIDLNVNRYNNARQFYERCGYSVYQEEDIPIGPYWMNDFVMRKPL
jgi:diamine N-acetyltransferase